jgi:curli biogenesis system outer membrane secretion channel CsgG
MHRLLVVFLAVAMSAAAAPAQAPMSQRPALTVAAFEFGTVATQINSDPRTRRRMEHAGVHDGNAFAEALGTGVVDLVVEKLIESQRFRVFERRQLEAVRREQQLDGGADDMIARARYLVTGSISRLGLNDKEIGGLAAGLGSAALFGRMVGLGMKHSSTSLHLTVRVVDTRTGEIIGSFTGEGHSSKRWGVTAFGLVPGGAGGARILDANFRETAIGEAATRAAAAVVDSVVALRATRLR